MGLAVLEQGKVAEVEPGQALEPGARVQITVRSHRGGYLYVASLDSNWNVTAMVPLPGEQASKVEPGRTVPVPRSVILDDAPFERVFVLVCPGTLEERALERTLQKMADRRVPAQSIASLPFECEQGFLDLPRRSR